MDRRGRSWSLKGGRVRGQLHRLLPTRSFGGIDIDPLGGTSEQHRIALMIIGFRESWLRAFYVDDMHSRHIPSDIEDRLFRKLQLIDDATCDADLRAPPSNHFEKLRGN